MTKLRWSRFQWIPGALFAAATASLAACAGFAGGDSVAAGTGGAGGGYGNGAGAGTSGDGGSGNGKNIVEPLDGENAAGGANGTGTSTSTQTGPAGSGGEGGGGGAGGGGEGGAPPDLTCLDTGSPRVFYLSSDDSSSMGSPALAREFLEAGLAPPRAAIRTWEFLNYYRVRYDPAPSDGLLGLHVSYVPVPGDSSKFRFQIGVQAFQVERPPMALTFVVDTSGSLIGEGIKRERAAIKAIAKKLQAGDHVNFVTWATEDAEILKDHAIAGPDDPVLLEAADALIPGGGSDLHSGLTHGYDLAAETAHPDALSRVVLISDGGANLGVVDRERIADEAKDGEDQGIYLVGVGVGPAQGYSDTLMNLVTDAGRGSYVYLDSTDEATRVLGDRFAEVMDIAARAVEVKLELPSYFAIEATSAEQISSDKEAVTPQHLAPGDSMVFFQTLGLCPGCKVCDADVVNVTVTWNAPALHPATSVGSKTFASQPFTLADIEGASWQLLKAEAIVQYATFLTTRRHADYDRAEKSILAAHEAALNGGDDHVDELEKIGKLLAQFPDSEKVD